MRVNLSYIKYLIISSLATGGLLLIPNSARGAVMDQLPVPTFDVATSVADETIVNITDAQKKDWSSTTTIPVNQMVKYPRAKVENVIFNFYTNSNRVKTETYTFKHSPSKVYAWTKTVADSVNSETAEPKLVIKNGRATDFTPPTIGKELDRYNSALQILQSLELGKTEVRLAVKTTQPTTLLEDTNDLGIKELIGRGESKFNGSPANRRHNIKVGVSKMQGVIVKPGDEFSFNKYLGPVEADQGFKPELVIKKTGTVPELGGGLCQVSSTTFRAAMHAGLPILERRNHSYAVQYYAPQGTDATIYPGVTDFRFKNDTGNSILIWPYFKTNDHLVFDFYGTYDGREVKLGTPSSYDKKPDGSMKSTWSRTVTKNGESKTDTFASVYQPPALFHKEEQFVSGDPTQPTTPATEVKPDDSKEPQPATAPDEPDKADEKENS